MPSDDLDHLRSENAELRRRLETTRSEVDELRADAMQRRADVRQLVADLPTVVSRRAVVSEMVREAAKHPDKPAVIGRALCKLGRGPRKAFRLITRGH